MAKQKTVDADNLKQLKVEATFARSIRKASFADTCSEIEKWAVDAKKKYLNGSSPTPRSVAYLVTLVKELATGTKETNVLTFTVQDIVNITGLELVTIRKRINEWGAPVVKQAGRRPGRWDLMKNLPILEEQFRDVDLDDWNSLIIRSGKSCIKMTGTL